MNSTDFVLSNDTATELERLTLLESYDIMHSDCEVSFDRISELVKIYFNTPMVAITFIGNDDPFIKSAIGIDASFKLDALPFCHYTVMTAKPVIIPDTLKSDIFANHPFVVAGPKIRFYAGVPILAKNVEGQHLAIGALCVLDTTPRATCDAQKLQILQHFSGIISDALELRRQRQLALKANETKATFLANISHEISTPMNGIIGMLDLLSHTDLTAEQQQYVNQLKNANTYLMNIMHDILDWSKIQSGQAAFNHQTVDIKLLCEQVFAGFSGLADEKQIRLLLDYPPMVPQDIVTDAMRVRQIVAKLVQNAIQLTPEDSYVLVSINSDDEYFNLSVSDSGKGLSNRVQAVMFEAYEHANEWLHRLYAGYGLGLSVCYSMAKGLGGQLLVSSQPNVGTTFTLQLPLLMPNDGVTCANANQAVETTPARLKAHILLAEDNELNAMVAIKTLKKYGYSLDRAKDGQEAVTLFSQQPEKYQLILMDHQMPIMDGVKATQLLKQRFANVPPIIAVTAHATHGDKEVYLKAGMQDCCTKPYKPEALDNMIQAWLHRSLQDRPTDSQMDY